MRVHSASFFRPALQHKQNQRTTKESKCDHVTMRSSSFLLLSFYQTYTPFSFFYYIYSMHTIDYLCLSTLHTHTLSAARFLLLATSCFWLPSLTSPYSHASHT